MRKLIPLLAVLAACYKTPQPPCAFLCGTDGSCPDGYQCSTDDDRCHFVESGGTLAACGDTLPPDATAHVDASTIDGSIDGSPIDSSTIDGTLPIDSMTAPDAFPTCTTALAPADDSTGRQALVISEIDPGTGGFVEVFDNTASDIDLGTSTAQLVSDGVTVALSTAGAGVTVHAHGQAVIPWPAALASADDAGGEVVLYLDTTTSDPTHIEDFVCWGAAPTTTLEPDAVTGGKWGGGACPTALTMGAIHRLPATTGLAAADYDVTAAPTPQTCEP